MLHFILCFSPCPAGIRKAVFLFILSFICFQHGFAGTKTWNGSAGDGLWSSPGNWNGNIIPTASDDVVLDNSAVTNSYGVILPDAAITVKTLTISADAGKTIQLVLPSTNTAEPAFTATGPGYSLLLNSGGVFINASGLTSGESLNIADSIRINNGGRYIHRTRASHASAIVRLLSAAAGTEKGVFEFDVPRASYTVSITNRRYGSLVFSSAAAGGSITYTGSGNNLLTVNGDLQINEGVTLKIDLSGANGNISVKGDYIQNGGVFDIASGAGNSTIARIGGNLIQSASALITESNTGLPAVELNGSAVQMISLQGSITNSVDLIMNNPAGAFLSAPLFLPYRLKLVQGKISTSAANLLCLQAGCSVEADSTMISSYIDGPLRKEGLSAEPFFLFPVGKDRLRWLELKNATGNFIAEFIKADPRTLGNVYGAGIDHISSHEYWQINADPAASAGIELSFAVPESGGITDLTALTAGALSAGTWIDAGHFGTTGTFSTAGSVISEAVNDFNIASYFTLASTSNGENPLPVELVYFNGNATGEHTILNWEIGLPADADHFEISAAGSNMNFTVVGRLQASADQTRYHFIYEAEQNGTGYYRLRIVEKNGHSLLSRIIAIDDRKDAGFKIWIATAAVHDKAVLAVVSPNNAEIQWTISDISGRIAKKGSSAIRAGTNTIPLNLQGLAAGIYQLTGFDRRKRIYVVRFVIV